MRFTFCTLYVHNSDDVDRGWEAYNTNVLYRDQGKKSSGHLSVEYLLVAAATSEFSGVDI